MDSNIATPTPFNQVQSNAPSSSSIEPGDFWDMVDELLKKFITQPTSQNINTNPRVRIAAVMRLLQKEHVEYVSNLSLDEIEAMASTKE
jgi:hypothetical protein